MCDVKRVEEYIIFKIFETFSTHGKAFGGALGEASGPIYMFIEFYEVMRITDSLLNHNFLALNALLTSKSNKDLRRLQEIGAV